MSNDIHNFEQRYYTWLEKLDNGDVPEKSGGLIKDFIRYKKGSGKKYSTLANTVGIALQVVGRTGKNVDELTERDFYDLTEQLEREHKDDYNYRKFIKSFFRWLTDDNVPKWVKNIKLVKKDTPVQPCDILTRDEIDKLLGACTTIMDKALLAVALDSAMRIGAIGTLRVKNVEFLKSGALLYASTTSETLKSTAPQPFPITWSTGYLSAWLDLHPDKTNPNRPLWVITSGHSKGKAYSYRALSKRLKHIGLRSGVKKRIHFHLFKHQKITEMILKGFSDRQINYQGGWAPDSKRMYKVYGNYFDKDMADSIMAHYGISKEDAKQVTLTQCPRCHAVLRPEARVCHQCALVLDASLDKERQAIEDDVAEKALLKLMENPKGMAMFKEMENK